MQLLGEKLLIKRIDGKVYAIRDRCLHRGVPLSRKPDCYTKDTITCWYHGYTYRFQTGELVNILAVPVNRTPSVAMKPRSVGPNRDEVCHWERVVVPIVIGHSGRKLTV